MFLLQNNFSSIPLEMCTNDMSLTDEMHTQTTSIQNQVSLIWEADIIAAFRDILNAYENVKQSSANAINQIRKNIHTTNTISTKSSQDISSSPKNVKRRLNMNQSNKDFTRDREVEYKRKIASLEKRLTNSQKESAVHLQRLQHENKALKLQVQDATAKLSSMQHTHDNLLTSHRDAERQLRTLKTSMEQEQQRSNTSGSARDPETLQHDLKMTKTTLKSLENDLQHTKELYTQKIEKLVQSRDTYMADATKWRRKALDTEREISSLSTAVDHVLAKIQIAGINHTVESDVSLSSKTTLDSAITDKSVTEQVLPMHLTDMESQFNSQYALSILSQLHEFTRKWCNVSSQQASSLKHLKKELTNHKKMLRQEKDALKSVETRNEILVQELYEAQNRISQMNEQLRAYQFIELSIPADNQENSTNMDLSFYSLDSSTVDNTSVQEEKENKHDTKKNEKNMIADELKTLEMSQTRTSTISTIHETRSIRDQSFNSTNHYSSVTPPIQLLMQELRRLRSKLNTAHQRQSQLETKISDLRHETQMQQQELLQHRHKFKESETTLDTSDVGVYALRNELDQSHHMNRRLQREITRLKLQLTTAIRRSAGIWRRKRMAWKQMPPKLRNKIRYRDVVLSPSLRKTIGTTWASNVQETKKKHGLEEKEVENATTSFDMPDLVEESTVSEEHGLDRTTSLIQEKQTNTSLTQEKQTNGSLIQEKQTNASPTQEKQTNASPTQEKQTSVTMENDYLDNTNQKRIPQGQISGTDCETQSVESFGTEASHTFQPNIFNFVRHPGSFKQRKTQKSTMPTCKQKSCIETARLLHLAQRKVTEKDHVIETLKHSLQANHIRTKEQHRNAEETFRILSGHFARSANPSDIRAVEFIKTYENKIQSLQIQIQRLKDANAALADALTRSENVQREQKRQYDCAISSTSETKRFPMEVSGKNLSTNLTTETITSDVNTLVQTNHSDQFLSTESKFNACPLPIGLNADTSDTAGIKSISNVSSNHIHSELLNERTLQENSKLKKEIQDLLEQNRTIQTLHTEKTAHIQELKNRLNDLETANDKLMLELQSRPTIRTWHEAEIHLQSLTLQVQAAVEYGLSQASLQRRAEELMREAENRRKLMPTTVLLEQDKRNRTRILKHTNKGENKNDACTDIVEQCCTILSLSDPTALPASIRAFSQLTETVPILEFFCQKVCSSMEKYISFAIRCGNMKLSDLLQLKQQDIPQVEYQAFSSTHTFYEVLRNMNTILLSLPQLVASYRILQQIIQMTNQQETTKTVEYNQIGNVSSDFFMHCPTLCISFEHESMFPNELSAVNTKQLLEHLFVWKRLEFEQSQHPQLFHAISTALADKETNTNDTQVMILLKQFANEFQRLFCSPQASYGDYFTVLNQIHRRAVEINTWTSSIRHILQLQETASLAMIQERIIQLNTQSDTTK